MSTTLYERNRIIKNIILFTLISFFFLFALKRLHQGESALDIAAFVSFLDNSIFLCFFGFLSISTLYFVRRISRLFFSIFSILILYEVFIIYISEWSNVVLLSGFTFLVFSYYLQIYLKLELSDAVYTSLFSSYLPSPSDFYQFNVRLEFPNGAYRNGLLTNWDENGCFVVFEDKIPLVSRNVEIFILSFGHSFRQRALVVSRSPRGLGVKFSSENKRQIKDGLLCWRDFYCILEDRGIFPVAY